MNTTNYLQLQEGNVITVTTEWNVWKQLYMLNFLPQLKP